jgi:sugar-phosphatase
MASSIAASPILIRCKGILFDMDGILISSLGSVERSWTRWANLRGVDPEHALRIVHGCRAIESVVKLRPDLDSEAELKIIEEMELEDKKDIALLPGVLKLLAALPPDRWNRPRWTVVTSATERLARVRLAAGGVPVPERLVTAESVTQGKPNPAPYLAGAALLGFAPEECVVFEDAASGVKAGRAAGCIVVATTFSHPVETLAGAHYLIKDVTGVEVENVAGDDGLVLKLMSLAG